MEPDDLLLLAQRAASEGPRWTRAIEDQSVPIPEEKTSEWSTGVSNSLGCRKRGHSAFSKPHKAVCIR
jgi:hypothetical protein